jgi:hypothetical protein
VANVVFDNEQATAAEALAGPDSEKWHRAMQEEYDSIMKNGTWTLVELPNGRKPVSCKWIFKVKYSSTGEVDRYKARLVARGFTQKHGIDYTETFAPVAKFTSIRCLMAIAAKDDMEIHQMDVKTAYLNGDLNEEIYMVQPEGFEQVGGETLVCKLNKSLYGLKQAGRMWYFKIDETFKELGFKRSDADHSIYVRITGDTKVYIALYVDDLIVVCNDLEVLEDLKKGLSKRYDMNEGPGRNQLLPRNTRES